MTFACFVFKDFYVGTNLIVDFFKFGYAFAIFSDKHIKVPEIFAELLSPGGKNSRKGMSNVYHSHFDIVDRLL